MKLLMVGTGYVGLVTGTCLASTGNRVTCLDVDPAKIERLRRGESPIYEPGLEDALRKNIHANRIHFTTDPVSYHDAEIIFICVGTPSDAQGHADLSFVTAVADAIGKSIEAYPSATGGPHAVPKIIVMKSTVPVGTNTRVRKAIAARTKKTFYMASNPEFLKEGAAIADFTKPDRVILGVDNPDAGERLKELYAPFVRQGNPIFVMDIRSAEMVKYAANTMLATKISFINEISALCEAFGADIDEVRRGMCADKRIGNQFLYPGLGYGGSCFPKDVLACVGMGLEAGLDTALLKAVHTANSAQRQRFIAKIDKHFGGKLKGAKIAVWGLAFKPGTDDMREAPSLTIIEHLLKHGASVVAFDPAAQKTADDVLKGRISYVDNELAAVDGAKALIICTEWEEFRNPDFDELAARMDKPPVIFDGRNLYRAKNMRDRGFIYHSVGRPEAEA